MIIFIAIVFLAGIVIIDFFTSIIVFGPILSEKKLDKFFGKHLQSYIDAKKGKRMYFGHVDLPYIAKVNGLIAWYIGSGYGSIPVWSKWNKKLQELHDYKEEKKDIADL